MIVRRPSSKRVAYKHIKQTAGRHKPRTPKTENLRFACVVAYNEIKEVTPNARMRTRPPQSIILNISTNNGGQTKYKPNKTSNKRLKYQQPTKCVSNSSPSQIYYTRSNMYNDIVLISQLGFSNALHQPTNPKLRTPARIYINTVTDRRMDERRDGLTKMESQ